MLPGSVEGAQLPPLPGLPAGAVRVMGKLHQQQEKMQERTIWMQQQVGNLNRKNKIEGVDEMGFLHELYINWVCKEMLIFKQQSQIFPWFYSAFHTLQGCRIGC